MTDQEMFVACGKYSRKIEVLRGKDKCFECQEKKEVLKFDSSDGEYSTMIFCMDCLKGFFYGWKSESTYSNDLSNQLHLL